MDSLGPNDNYNWGDGGGDHWDAPDYAPNRWATTRRDYSKHDVAKLRSTCCERWHAPLFTAPQQ